MLLSHGNIMYWLMFPWNCAFIFKKMWVGFEEFNWGHHKTNQSTSEAACSLAGTLSSISTREVVSGSSQISEKILILQRPGDDSFKDKWIKIITIFGFHSPALANDLQMKGTKALISHRLLDAHPWTHKVQSVTKLGKWRLRCNSCENEFGCVFGSPAPIPSSHHRPLCALLPQVQALYLLCLSLYKKKVLSLKQNPCDLKMNDQHYMFSEITAEQPN